MKSVGDAIIPKKEHCRCPAVPLYMHMKIYVYTSMAKEHYMVYIPGVNSPSRKNAYGSGDREVERVYERGRKRAREKEKEREGERFID